MEKFKTHVGYLNITNQIQFQVNLFILGQTSLFLAHQIVLFLPWATSKQKLCNHG